MTRATIPTRRKHLYFYTVLILATVDFILLKPVALDLLKTAVSAKSQPPTRAAEANKLANTLFQ